MKKQLRVSDIEFSGPVGPFASKDKALESAKRGIDDYLEGTVTIKGYQCPICYYIVHSRTSKSKKDIRWCPCRNLCIGYAGSDYSIKEGDAREIEFIMEITNIELYNDWKTGKNKYGLINQKSMFERRKIKS